MQFKIETSADIYWVKKEVERLREIGFKFKANNIDDPSEWLIQQVPITKEFNSLEDLMAFIKDLDEVTGHNGVIITSDNEIEIYDNYIE